MSFWVCASRGLSQGDEQDEVGGEVWSADHLLYRHAWGLSGVGAEERGQAQVIAESMFLMSRLRTPIICVVIGEGGSGGALGIGVGDRIAMLQYSYYSVISPEGCAGILWKSHQHAPKAAETLRFTSKHLKQLEVIDDVIDEPLGGAHRDHHQTASRLKSYLVRTLESLRLQPVDQLVESRYEKFRSMGAYLQRMEDGQFNKVGSPTIAS